MDKIISNKILCEFINLVIPALCGQEVKPKTTYYSGIKRKGIYDIGEGQKKT